MRHPATEIPPYNVEVLAKMKDGHFIIRKFEKFPDDCMFHDLTKGKIHYGAEENEIQKEYFKENFECWWDMPTEDQLDNI